MEELTVRLLPDRTDDGPTQMAADEILLRSATKGIASLRFYCWSKPTLSLGYFQQAAGRLDDPLLRELPFVRRATGGMTLVHHHELTYALAVPTAGLGKAQLSWLRMHAVIRAALAEFAVHADLWTLQMESRSQLCFHHFTPGDLMLEGAKIGGSAQRRQHGALLQHGGILLARSPFTPSLPGIRELTGIDLSPHPLRDAIAAQTTRILGWRLKLDDWTAVELMAIKEIAEQRYRADAWNRKR